MAVSTTPLALRCQLLEVEAIAFDDVDFSENFSEGQNALFTRRPNVVRTKRAGGVSPKNPNLVSEFRYPEESSSRERSVPFSMQNELAVGVSKNSSLTSLAPDASVQTSIARSDEPNIVQQPLSTQPTHDPDESCFLL